MSKKGKPNPFHPALPEHTEVRAILQRPQKLKTSIIKAEHITLPLGKLKAAKRLSFRTVYR